MQHIEPRYRIFLKEIKNYSHLARLSQPIGTWLCLLPALWGLDLSTPSFQPYNILLFILGALFIRSAGCTINDYWDQSLDKHVKRTQNRPLARSALSKPKTLFFFCVLMVCGALVLFQFNVRVICMGIFITLPLIAYPLFKRFTYWPQAFLGIVFNWGLLMGWLVNQSNLNLGICLIYVGCIFWTMGYDTVYAFQDYEGDKNYGVKSTALFWGYKKGKIFVQGCYLVFLLCLWGGGILLNQAGLIISAPALILWSLYKVKRLDLKSSTHCAMFFLWNRDVGLLIWAFIFLLKLIKYFYE